MSSLGQQGAQPSPAGRSDAASLWRSSGRCFAARLHYKLSVFCHLGWALLMGVVFIRCDTQRVTPPEEGLPPDSTPPEPILWESPSRAPINVEGFPTSPDLALVEEAVVLAFHDVREGNPYNEPGDVYAMRRDDQGWSDPVNVSRSDEPSSQPVIASGPRGTLHLVWGERRVNTTPRPGGTPDAFYYAQSRDDGQSWSTAEQVFATSGTGFFSSPRSIVFDADGHVHVVFSSRETENTPATVKHMERTESGWGEATDITIGGSPDLARTGEGELVAVHLSADTSANAPDRNSLFLSRSTDDGETWGTPQLIERSGFDQPAQSPQIVQGADPQELYLTWSKSTDGDLAPDAVFMIYSDDRGDTWRSPREVSFDESGTPSPPDVTVDDAGAVNIAFQVGGAGASAFPAYITRCSATSCSDTENLFGTNGAGSQIGIAAGDGQYFVSLRAVDLADGQGIYFSTSKTTSP